MGNLLGRNGAITVSGAESLARTLAAGGVEICFSNPGTTEMHLVQAIDGVAEIRAILCLFEGVCTGAADGFGRMTGRPATTLLHLGPGLGNGVANLHNARRARTPIINLVGNHASYHLKCDAPLTSDIDSLARAVSCWYKSDSTADSLAQDGADALSAAMSANGDPKGQIATLIVGSDAAWGEASDVAKPNPVAARQAVADQSIELAARSLDCNALLLLDGPGVSARGMEAAARIAAKTGCQLRSTFAPARLDGGAGRPAIKRLPYFPEQVRGVLEGVQTLILAGAKTPVAFFAYPHLAGNLIPEDCEIVTLARVEQDVVGALEAVADLLSPSAGSENRNSQTDHEVQPGRLTGNSAAAVIANRVPEGCIVVLDSGAGNIAFDRLQTALPNTWLSITGGSIGQGGPVAVGAAVACPDRQVLTLQGDGGAMYTNQSFWTQAREGLNVTTVIYSNREYWILGFEHSRLNLPELSDEGQALFSLDRPPIDWVGLAASMGVPGVRVNTSEAFDSALQRSFAEPGPFLIEAETPRRDGGDFAALLPTQRK